MIPEIMIDYFSKFLSQIDDVGSETKDLVQHEVQKKVKYREMKGGDDPVNQILHFQIIMAEIIKEQWSKIPKEDRLLLCFPAAANIGDSFEIPKRGKGTILRRELTKRLGMEMTFRMEDGSIFKWEFFD